MAMVYFAFVLGSLLGAAVGATLMQHKDQDEIDRLEIENSGLRAEKFNEADKVIAEKDKVIAYAKGFKNAF